MSPQPQVDHDPKLWRCGVCLFVLPGDLETIEDDVPPPVASHKLGGAHHSRLSGLWRSVDRGCEVCVAIVSITGLSRDKDQERDLVWAYGKMSIPSVIDKEYRIFVGSGNEPTSSDLRAIHPCLNVGTYPSGDTSSARAFDMLKARMEKCLSNHSQCSALGEGGPMPGRVLYIEDSKSLAVRLVDDTSSMEPQPYACLSHRWTEQTESSSLTLDRLETFKKQIPTDLLYPLLRDAFEAAGRLGFRYMWIDCLCICQDDLDDWNRQASGMSAIYENAVVTISALDAQINDWRLFAKHTPEKTQKLCTRDGQTIMISELNKEHPFFVDTVGTKYRASSVEKGFPFLTRGWVYQERLLARRIIHFTRNEVIWECKEAMSCECGHNEGAWKMVKREAPSLSDMTWSGICAEYTKTELSIDADKLPALSGVARRFGEAHGWTYLAGVWREDPDLCALLLWFSSNSHVRKHIPGLPSWSWASVEAARFFPVFHQHRMLFRVVAHEVVPGAVPYSTPASAKLVIEGRCSPVTIKFKAGSSEDGILTFSGDETQHTCFMDYVRDESEKEEIEQSSDIVFFLCFRDEDGPCGLLLKPVGPEENTYERIALFSWWGSIEESSLDRKRITLV